MYNPFTNVTVPLGADLDAVIGGKVSDKFRICKMLVRSTADDDLVVAVMTNNRNHPVILCRPGKGSWAPAPRTMPYVRIVDVLFHGDRLYGVTGAEDLADDGDGRPTVANVQRLIEHPPGHQEVQDDCLWWS